jgi:hypothetical protein
MHLKTLLAAVAAVLALSGPALAACVNYPIITPDTAPVNRLGVTTGGSNANLGGTAYTKATFCPAKAAAGTCTGESLSEKVATAQYAYVTLDGIVADIERHKNGFYIPLPGPDLFVPTTGYLPGAC